MNILQIITKTPTWVWIIFAYLIASGIQSTQSYIIPAWRLMIMPIIFITWSLYGIISKNNLDVVSLSYWLIALIIGMWIGSKIFNHKQFHMNQQTKLIHISGTYTNLILSLTFFLIKYIVNVIYALEPIMRSNIYLMNFDILTSALISGIFFSRAITISFAWIQKKD